MGRAVLFVDYGDDGKLFINPEAADLLTTFEEEIGIIGVMGIPGSGKSFTLNELRPSNEGFEVGSDVDRCTQGMWLWDTLIPQASGHKALLLDCEGFNSHSKRGRARRHLLYLSVLLSSVIINTQIGGRIFEKNLDTLSPLMGVTDEISVGGTQQESDYKSVFPTFVWLIRDFIGSVRVQQNPDQLLDKALMDEDDVLIGQRVKELFPSMHCYTLPRPAKEEEDLQNLSQTKNTNLRPCYKEKRLNFLDFVSSKSRLKMVDGMVLTGPMLVGITRQFIDCFNKDAVPAISSIWKNAKDHINRHQWQTQNKMSPVAPRG